MKQIICGLLIVALSAGFWGCATAARDTTGFAQSESVTVDASFEETWAAVRDVLREMDLEIYTRDKRGKYVAYDDMRRAFVFFTPTRTQYTIVLNPVSSEATQITIEAIKQIYGVSLLTYPDWHDRKTEKNETLSAVLKAIQDKLTATG